MRRRARALFAGTWISGRDAGEGVAGTGGAQLLHFLLPVLPVRTPWSFVVAAELLAIAIGLAAGALPARRASRVTPVTALQAE